MATLEQLRSLFPSAGSDADVIKLASKEFGINPTDIASEIGFDINKPGFGSDIKRGIGQVASAIGSTAKDVGLETFGRAAENYGENTQFKNPSQINTVGEAVRSPLTTIRESISEVIPQIGVSTALGMGGRALGGMIGGAIGNVPGAIAGQALGGSGAAYLGNLIQEYGGIRSEQRKQGIDDKTKALGAGGAAALLDTAFGAEAITNKFLSKGSNILAREAETSWKRNVGKQTAIGLGTESVTEGLQTGLERYGASQALTGDEALNEYGLAAIKGGIGGGVVRGGLASVAGVRPPEGGNDVEQSFKQPDVSGTPTSNNAPAALPTAPSAIPLSTTATTASVDQNAPPAATDTTPITTPNAAPTPPAVSGGETDIAQQTQAAAADNAKIEAAQQQQAKRDDALSQFATAYNPEDPTSLKILGQDIVGAPRVAAFGDAFANELTKIPGHGIEIAKAIVQANDATGGKLVSFSFNANNVGGSALKAAQAINKAATKFQIDHVQSADEAAQVLNKLSMTAKGNQLEQLNAIHEALTGKDTDGFIASQTAEGAKNGKQLQNNAGVGKVSIEGGSAETSNAGAGIVQPGGVQPVGTGSFPEGSLGLQVGQPSGEGIRTGTSAESGTAAGNFAPQVTGETNGQAQITSGLGDGGQVSGQPEQEGELAVVADAEEPASETSQEELVKSNDIISTLYSRVLAPRGGTTTLAQRIEIVRLALNEQASEDVIAELTGLPATTIDAQLRRLGVVLRPQTSQAALDERAAIAERLGLTPEVLEAAFDIDSKKRGKFLSDNITVNVTPEDRVRSIERLVATMAGQNMQYVVVTPKAEKQRDGSEKAYERLDVLIQKAADEYRSPEFPQGIPRRDLLELHAPRKMAVNVDNAAQLQEEIAKGPEQDFDKTKLLAEELYSDEDQDTQSMGTVAKAGGSQGAVEGADDAFFARVGKLQAMLAATPETDTEGRANVEKLIEVEYAKYAKKQLNRAENSGEIIAPKLDEEEQALLDEETAATPKEDETSNAAAKARDRENLAATQAQRTKERKGFKEGDTVVNPKLGTGVIQGFSGNGDQTMATILFQSGATKDLMLSVAKLEKANAVQIESADAGNVRQPTGNSETVGEGNAKPEKVARKGKAKTEPKQEVIKIPAEEWVTMQTVVPQLPAYNTLDENEQARWDDLVNRGTSNLAAAVKIISERLEPTGTALANNQSTTEGTTGTTQALTNDANVIDVEARVIDETVGPQVAALPAPQVTRLENHYGVKQDSPDFLAKVKEDVVKYATKGAEAVSAAIRDIIKAIHTGVLAAAMIFNPTSITQLESFVVIPQETRTTQEQVLAKVPAEASMMSDAGKQAYERLIPALKGKIGDKFITIADKPSGRIFVFKSDGTFVLQKKSLFGFAKGDLYKGNNDLPQNRITPAGLFGIHIVDASKGGASAKTAGDYDFGKVFALDDPDATVTFMHSVWLKEKDASQRAAALKNESAADSRYSFGCINVDKETYRTLITKYGNNMDGSKLFVVPDQQSTVQDFLSGNVANDKLVREGVQPVTRTVSAPVKSATQTASVDRTVVGKDEETTAFNSRSAKFMEFTELEDEVDGVNDVRTRFADLDIEHALDFVSDWQIVNDTASDAFHAQLKVENGRYIGVLNMAKMTSPAYVAEATSHEVAHAVDMAPHGGVYSHQLEMNVEIKNGQVVPVGDVAKEMFSLYQTDPAFTRYLAYPFNLQDHPDLNTNGKIESELFAQIFSLYSNPKYTDYIASVAPKTAVFMEEVLNDIRTTSTLQIQKSTTASTRALDFRNRYTARRDQRTSGTNGGAGQTLRGPFNSRGQGQEFTVDQAIGRLPPTLQRPTRNIITNLLHQAKRGLYASAITEDVVSMASKYMKSAQKYLTAQYARQATRLNFEKDIETILSAFDKLPVNLKGEGKGSVNEFIYDSTRQKKWGYYPGEHRVSTKLFDPDPDFKERFNAFPPAAQRVIKSVFEHGYQALMSKQRAARTAIEREFAEREAAAGNDADLLKEINKEKKLMLTRQTRLSGVDVSDPYAYLGRYGDYIVVAKSKEFIAYEEAAKGTQSRAQYNGVVGDPQQAKNWLQDNVSNPLHYVVQFAETQGEADEIAAKLQATGHYDVQPEDAGIREAHESYAGNNDMHMAVARLRKLAERREDTNDDALNKMISDLYLMTVAEASARRTEFERKNVTGADINMMRNLATSGRADAHFLSTMEHSEEITDSLEAMRDEALRNRKEAMPLYNELYNRYAGSTNYEAPGPLTTALTRMSTLWYLSTNPAFYLQQVLQTGVLSLPYMAGRLGYFRSARAIKRAYTDMSDLVAGLGINDHINFDKAPDDVRFMLKALVGMGKIDIGIDADAKARTEDKGVLGTVMHKLQGVNTRIETINRAVAAIAAYRGYMDRYKGAIGADGVRYAAEVVSNTHGSYDGFNTPRVMQGGTAKVLLQFKRFQIIQLSMLAKLIHTAFSGASPAEKAVARASLKYLTAHMAVLGGALAVPFVSQIAWILSKVLGAEDEPDDYEYKLRRWIGDEAVADLLLKGVPAALGVDLSGKLGMQNVASILPFADGDLTSRAGAEKILVGIMGPSANLGIKFADALGMMTKGEYYKGLEIALPNGIGNAMKGYRFATEGITMRNGDLVMKPEEISMVDAAFQAVGLPTAPITDRQYTQRVVMEFDKFYADRASDIKRGYVQGSRSGDYEAMAESRSDWEKLQVSRAANGYKRQPMSDLYRAPAAAAKREKGVVGGVETTKSNRRFVEQVNSVS